MFQVAPPPMIPSFCASYSASVRRYWASKDEGVKLLQGLFDGENVPDTAGAREYVEGRTWEIAVNQLENAMKEMKNG